MDVKDELVTASEEYNNYSGINSDDMNGKVRFVFKVEESEDKDTKSESQKTDTTKDRRSKNRYSVLKLEETGVLPGALSFGVADSEICLPSVLIS